MSVIIVVREVINATPEELVVDNDKRKNIIELFSSFDDYPENIHLKKIDYNQIEYEDMKTFYNSIVGGLGQNDLIYFIDDRSTSLITSDKLKELNDQLANIINNNGLDIIYLADAMENCNTVELYDKIDNIEILKAKSPNGLFGVVSTKLRWDNVFSYMKDSPEIKATSRLNTLISNGELKAATVWPRIIVPNIMMIEQDSVDNFYTYPCRIESDFGKTIQNNEGTSFFSFVFGAICIFLIAWFLSKMNEHRSIKKKRTF